MTWLSEHWLHLIFVSVYFAVLLRHAVVGHRRVHSLDDYLVAGRGLGGWVIGLSFYATFMSTNTFIGAAGKSWDIGLIWCLGGLVHVVCCCASWFIVAPRFVPLTKQYQSLTIADFLGTRYGSTALRSSSAAIVAFASVIYLVAIYRGSAVALRELLDVPYSLAIILIFAIVTSYTLAGGFKSVVLTDALQGFLMVAGAIGMITAVTLRGGGLQPIIENLRAQDAQLVAWRGHDATGTVLALSLAVGIKYLVEPRQLSRFYGLRDGNAMRLASIVTLVLATVTYICLLPLGAFAHALIPADAISSSDEVIPYLLGSTDVMGPALGILFLLVLVSAAMSSIDSVLLVAAATIDQDILPRESTTAAAVRRTRRWVVVVSLASAVVALSPFTKDIMSITAFSGSLYAACFLPALVIGLYWRPSAYASLASIIIGAITVLGWYTARMQGWTRIHEVYIGIAVGLAVFLFVGCVLPKSDSAGAS